MSVARGRSRVGRVADIMTVVRLTMRRKDAAAVVALVTGAYLLTFLWATGDLSFRTGVEPALVVVHAPLERLFTRTGPASFDAVAMVDTGVIRLLVSPINIALGVTLAALVGINLGVTYLAIRQPSACGISAGSGVLASFPALLSGTVCCGPVILLAVGIQASAALMTMFFWLVPIGVLLLLGTLVYVGGKVDPAAATR